MPKRVAVIDIGSNSARVVIYQRTSRFGFHLIFQQKSRVRIGEGAYQKGGNLQKEGILRAFRALLSFSHSIKEYKVRKVHCVATSALRDAPNKSEFISLVKKELGIKIRVIDGDKEAFYGAVAAINLLPVKSAITVDIGGGSTDMALIQDGKILKTISLNLGTVRLKELFSDKGELISGGKKFIEKILDTIPKDFKADCVIGIGGTSRALAKSIMKKENYPFEKIHAFRYKFDKKNRNYLEEIAKSSIKDLKKFNIKESRFDTIREGSFILLKLLEYLDAKEVLSSGVGVREGVFLSDLLRNSKYKFPPNINPSIRSIKDRFDILKLPEGNKKQIASKLFETLKDEFDGSYKEKDLMQKALNLSNIGKILTIYKSHQHAFYIASQELNFGFFHEEIIFISLILRSRGDSLYYKPLYKKYKDLLPDKKTIKWVCFIYTLSLILNENSSQAKIEFEWNQKELKIISNKNIYLASEEINALEKPKEFKIKLIEPKLDIFDKKEL
jgi:exopolyphosphatase/guanosine-5'-triphosphate,3'-diphosphate pyrophosphatase